MKNRQTFSPVSALSASMKQLSLPLPHVPPEITLPSHHDRARSILRVGLERFPAHFTRARVERHT